MKWVIVFFLFFCHSGEGNGKLFPEIEPYRTGHLKVSPVHEIYFEESGNPNGEAALFLHGGPGSGTRPKHRRLYDPSRFRIILFDQRGSGHSRPAGELQDNTIESLTEDIEKLRKHLGVDKWRVYGGSWGSTLGLYYAEKYPHAVKQLILRGIYLGTREETESSFLPGGVNSIFPDAWEKLQQSIPTKERKDLLNAYYRRLFDPDPKVVSKAVKDWGEYEDKMSHFFPIDPQATEVTPADIQRARIELHYFKRGVFSKKENNKILDAVSSIRSMPTIILQGRHDLITPFESAWRLHKALPAADFRIVTEAGHSWEEPAMLEALLLALNQ